MVRLVRKGKSLREVAKHFGVNHRTVSLWVKRARGQRLDRVDFSDKARTAPPVNKTSDTVEKQILDMRRYLKEDSDHGEHRAEMIRHELTIREKSNIPSVRTIGRILDRHGVLDGKRRVRRKAPPKGWYLPDVAAFEADIDSFDVIEDMRIKNGPLIDVLTVTSVLGRLPGAWPVEGGIRARFVLETLLCHWREHGLPDYVQFDNDTRFHGPHHLPDVIGRVVRLSLSLGVTPVFAPPAQHGFQASIENFNGRWEKKVWSRFHHHSLPELCQRSQKYLAALRRLHAVTIENAPPRRDFPQDWELDLQKHPSGRIIYLRRSTEKGSVSFLGHTFQVDSRRPNRLVRCEVDLDENEIRFFALRRREPQQQPMLNTLQHEMPKRKFHE